jgi:pyridoxal 5'-phosphate synthase pdxT subunit
MKVGIVALQGDFEKHAGALQRLETEWLFVRRQSELDQADALILPGGESSTMLLLLDEREAV